MSGDFSFRFKNGRWFSFVEMHESLERAVLMSELKSSVTKEIRTWARENLADGTDEANALSDIIDRIDEAVGALEKAYERDKWDSVKDETDAEIVKHGLARLPPDPDGKAWWPGDSADKQGFADKVKTMAVSRNSDGTITWTLITESYATLDAFERNHIASPRDRILECAEDLLRGKTSRPDPKLGDDVMVTVAEKLRNIAGELGGDAE